MSFEVNIKNASDGSIAEVTPNNQLAVKAESNSQQHYISRNFGQSYQIFGRTGTLTSATTTVLHIRNNDPERDIVISFMRMQLVGANVADSVDDYFELGFGREVGSGGAEVTAVNMNRKVGAQALVTGTDSGPTMTGTFLATERWHPPTSGSANTFQKDGSIILGLGDAFEIRYVGTSTTGIAEARITFMMTDQ